jgi:L-threonylcarbamoyladenylate synthase
MITIKYQKQNHKTIVRAVALALNQGKVVAYPTDTSYGLAVDAFNPEAIKKLYKVKERTFKKPVHIVIGSIAQAKQLAEWNAVAQKIAKTFWPGPVSLVLGINSKLPLESQKFLKKFSAGTNTIGLRMPANNIALDLAKALKRPITATSANPSAHLSGGYDSYSAMDIEQQFSKQKHKPDIIIDAGRLPKRKPSTFVKIDQKGNIEFLRIGPISKRQILQAFV